MPTTTAHGYVKPASRLEPADGYGAIGALADSVEARAAFRETQAQQVATTADATPTSTANVTLTHPALTITATATTDIFWVAITADVVINTASTINFVELLVDGVAQAATITCRGGATDRYTQHRRWKVTGLAAGSHTISARTRNNAAATSATVVQTNTTISTDLVA